MSMKPLSKAEELSLKSKKQEKVYVQDKNDARSERAAHIANLKAQRLAKEASDIKATKKLARAVMKKK
ncbi:MAG: hypothetical protein HWE34_15555 [Methylocystaceae bacterium]|nr:hypothetical protein [Methylocystaceae bacterium]